MNDTTEFYKTLLKSELTLKEREKFEMMMKNIVKARKEKEWKILKQQENTFKSSLAKLKSSGYLQINYPKT